MGRESEIDRDNDLSQFIQIENIRHFFSSYVYFADSRNIDSGIDFGWVPLSDDHALLSKKDVRFYKDNSYCLENWICFEVGTFSIACDQSFDFDKKFVTHLELLISHSDGIDKFFLPSDIPRLDCLKTKKKWTNLLKGEKYACMGIKYLSHVELLPDPTGTKRLREWRFDQMVTRRGRNCYPHRSKDCLSKRFSREDGC